jgi:hypothetical protein
MVIVLALSASTIIRGKKLFHTSTSQSTMTSWLGDWGFAGVTARIVVDFGREPWSVRVSAKRTRKHYRGSQTFEAQYNYYMYRTDWPSMASHG